jgi:hypothetical protein
MRRPTGVYTAAGGCGHLSALLLALVASTLIDPRPPPYDLAQCHRRRERMRRSNSRARLKLAANVKCFTEALQRQAPRA